MAHVQVIQNQETGDYLQYMIHDDAPKWTTNIERAFRYYSDSEDLKQMHLRLCRKQIGKDSVKAVDYRRQL